MDRWYDALRIYRHFSLEKATAREPRPLMFVLCSENYAAAALVAGCEPALVLQMPGGAQNPADGTTRATFDYAIREQGVRNVVVCGHQGCRMVEPQGLDPRRATQAAVVSQCVALREDKHIGPLLSEHHVVLQPVWFDVREGDVFRCNFENERVELMSDDDLAKAFRLVARGPH